METAEFWPGEAIDSIAGMSFARGGLSWTMRIF